VRTVRDFTEHGRRDAEGCTCQGGRLYLVMQRATWNKPRDDRRVPGQGTAVPGYLFCSSLGSRQRLTAASHSSAAGKPLAPCRRARGRQAPSLLAARAWTASIRAKCSAPIRANLMTRSLRETPSDLALTSTTSARS
jgi:hypothetical protein